MCKMTEDKNEDNVTLKKSGKEETMALNKAAAPPTRSAMPAATGNIQAAAAVQWLRASRWLTSKDQKIRDGFSTKMKLLCISSYQRKKSWDMYQVRLLRCGILPSSLRVLLLLLVSLAGLPLLASCFFFFLFRVVLLRIRGFCDLV